MTRNRDAFIAERERLKAEINAIDRDTISSEPDRKGFFDTVYDNADDNPARVPWADLAPKEKLAEWLESHPGEGRTAIDIACGLGDNAEALGRAGYKTTAFDYAEKAVTWARERFPESPVDYRQADLFDLPEEWIGAFDLAHECYTIQSVPPEMRRKISQAIASLVAPEGTLLIIARVREEGTEHDGPPWPLMPSELAVFKEFGLDLVHEEPYEIVRPDRRIAHMIAEWRKPSG